MAAHLRFLSAFALCLAGCKEASAPQTSAPQPNRIGGVERRLLGALAQPLGLAYEQDWQCRDRARLLAHWQIRLNAAAPIITNAARTPWLLPYPEMQPSRLLADAAEIPFTVGQTQLPANARLYQLTLTNTTDVPLPMPILHHGQRWDAMEPLVESSGLRAITDEIDRAIAVWKFIATNRYHADPVTEQEEEHDIIRFLSSYGYGFCDDSAQAVATLAEAVGLRARIRGLGGHVVPELFAAGAWRMFDPDFAVYFHAPGEPRSVLGVEMLERERGAFRHALALGPGGPWDAGYAEPFLSREDNGNWPHKGTAEHRIAHTLQPGERVTFSNFHWGRYFLGAYARKVPRFYNGTFDRPILGKCGTPIHVTSPFPIVGGALTGLPENSCVELAEGTRRWRLAGGSTVVLDGALAQFTSTPTRELNLFIQLPEGKDLSTARLWIDFQFAEMALPQLQAGAPPLQVEGLMPGISATLRWR